MTVSRTLPLPTVTDVVTFTILVNGAPLPSVVPVKGITIHKEVNKIPFARIKVIDGDPANAEFKVSDGDHFLPGKEVEIRLGYGSENETVFKGVVTHHCNKISSKSAELNIECKDSAFRMTTHKKSKHYEDVTDGDIAEMLIDQYNLTKDIAPFEIEHKEVVQYHTTDWDFMLSRIDLAGRICLVEDGKILIRTPDLQASAVIDLLYGATILDYNAEIDTRNQFSEVMARSWNPVDQEVVEETADQPQFTDAGNISFQDLSTSNGDIAYILQHAGVMDSARTRAWASACLQRQRLSKVRGHVRFQGLPGIKPGDTISLNGVGDRFNGPVFVNSVKHEFLQGNWTTEVGFGMPATWFAQSIDPYHPSAQIGFMPSVQGLQIGLVTDLEDPLGEYRVKVRFPIANEQEEGIWMRIATLDAGSSRGTFFRPEIDDEVIVGFIFNDPDNPVILGMLHSSSLPAPLEPSNENHKKGYVSRNGISMIFDDEEDTFTIETPKGKKVILNDEAGTVQIIDEHGNEVLMESSSVTIKSAGSLNLKAAKDIKLEATNIMLSPSSQFTVSAGGSEIKAGSGSVELKSPSVKVEGSGMAEIKGGMVMIN